MKQLDPTFDSGYSYEYHEVTGTNQGRIPSYWKAPKDFGIGVYFWRDTRKNTSAAQDAYLREYATWQGSSPAHQHEAAVAKATEATRIRKIQKAAVAWEAHLNWKNSEREAAEKKYQADRATARKERAAEKKEKTRRRARGEPSSEEEEDTGPGPGADWYQYSSSSSSSSHSRSEEQPASAFDVQEEDRELYALLVAVATSARRVYTDPTELRAWAKNEAQKLLHPDHCQSLTKPERRASWVTRFAKLSVGHQADVDALYHYLVAHPDKCSVAIDKWRNLMGLTNVGPRQ
jgi:hypothetical protein